MLFFVPHILESSRAIELSAQQIQHLKARRILNSGQELVLCTTTVCAKARLEITKKSIFASIFDIQPLAPWTAPKLRLYIAAIKPDRMSWLIEKATELGVYELIPFRAERSQGVYCTNKHTQHYQQVAIGACTQSQRKHLLQISELIESTEQAHLHAQKQELRTFSGLLAQEESTQKNHSLCAPSGPLGDIALFIGPEGGWSPAEQHLLENKTEHLAYPFGILRSETAALCLSSWLLGLASHEKKHRALTMDQNSDL